MSDIGGAIRSIDELVDEVTRLHVLLRGNRDYPGILEESVKLIDRLDGVAGHLASASLLSEQLGALPDRLLRSALDAPTAEARYEIYQQMEKILLDEMPIMPIFFYTRARLVNPRVKGFFTTPLDNYLWKYADVAR